MTPLQKYNRKTVTLQLPGDLTVFTIDWLSLYDTKQQRVLGSIIIPEDLNVPPSLVEIIVSIKNYDDGKMDKSSIDKLDFTMTEVKVFYRMLDIVI